VELNSKTVAILAADHYEDLEFWYPYYRMKEAGVRVVVIGCGSGPVEVHSKHNYPVKLDMRAKEANPDDFDAVIIPGGYAPDLLRRCQETLKFVRSIAQEGKVTAAICHAGWVLISAGVIEGKMATSFFSIKDDMINAGAKWVDKEVVVDENIITSRSPDDLPAFCKEIIDMLAGRIKTEDLSVT
jgi:protease I